MSVLISNCSVVADKRSIINVSIVYVKSDPITKFAWQVYNKEESTYSFGFPRVSQYTLIVPSFVYRFLTFSVSHVSDQVVSFRTG